MNALRTLWNLIVVVLALNFVGMALALALVAQRAHLDRAKIAEIRRVLFPPEEPEAEPDEVEVEPPPPTPMEQLIALLDAQSGKPTEQQVEDVRQAFDQRAAALDRARRELMDRQRLADAAAEKLLEERAAFARERAAWEQEVAAARDRAQDEGFQQALALYQQIPAKQVKDIFLQLEDEVVLGYLREMDTRLAAKILKEFKTATETARARTILEQLRQGDAAAASAGQ